MAFNFQDLNLSNVKAAGDSNRMQPGVHVATIIDSTIRATQRGGAQAVLKYRDNADGTEIQDFINLQVVGTPNAATATEIGREKFKAVLVHGGHPNPDRPGDISTCRGLTVGLRVKASTYEKDGEIRKGSEVDGYLDPRTVQASAPANLVDAAIQSAADSFPNDRVPF